MVSGKNIAALLVAGTIAMTLFSPVLATVNTTTGTQSVTNETFTAQTGEYVDLDGYDIEQGSETVYAYDQANDTYVQVTDSEYNLNASAGTIQDVSGGEIDDGEDTKITYDYQATDGTTSTIAALVPTFMALLVVGTFAGKITGAI
jgi:hypothetical protein